MSDKMSKSEWVERCAARLLARRPAMESAAAIDLAQHVWAAAREWLDPEHAADMELRNWSDLEHA